MPGLTKETVAKTNGAKRQRISSTSTSWDANCKSLIAAADDVGGCSILQSKLENLLKEVKEKKAVLEEKTKKNGLNYDGADGIKCKCGNAFEPEGDFAAICESCESSGNENVVEKCIECVVNCEVCGKSLCGDCRKSCQSCGENFCSDCVVECCSCFELYCGRDKRDCGVITVGYRGEQSCLFCLEPR